MKEGNWQTTIGRGLRSLLGIFGLGKQEKQVANLESIWNGSYCLGHNLKKKIAQKLVLST